MASHEDEGIEGVGEPRASRYVRIDLEKCMGPPSKPDSGFHPHCSVSSPLRNQGHSALAMSASASCSTSVSGKYSAAVIAPAKRMAESIQLTSLCQARQI